MFLLVQITNLRTEAAKEAQAHTDELEKKLNEITGMLNQARREAAGNKDALNEAESQVRVLYFDCRKRVSVSRC